ncbi:TPR-like protein [Gymnopus androsaceus JB14]|uniref:TPR-like protein n=1 Tax=Gymnopus androsaceus JB14 TaxID=1447944 RepID=A0A6A4IIL9_9AGAR|nr:TPR-like protein [Gymnopus androsaceus JB14]
MVFAGGESRQSATITYENIKLATPTAPRVFTGRDNLVTEGVEMLCKRDQAYLAILGAGGMGKTSLALHVMEHADVRKKFQEKRYFLPCEVLPDAPSLIQGLLQILKISISEGKDGYEILEAYLQSSQEPILLVLDNFETPWHSSKNQKAVQNLIEEIHDQGKVSIILTMRGGKAAGDIEWDKLGGKSGLPPLTLRAAREAFLSISPATKESEELDLSKRLPLEVLIKNWAKSKTDMLRNENQDSRLTRLIYEKSTSLRMLSPIREYVQTKHPVTQHHLDQIRSFYVQLLQNLPQSKLEAQDILEVHTANISTIFTRQFEIAPQQAHLEAIYCFAEFSKFCPQTLPMLEKALTQEWNDEQQEHINIRFLKAGIMRWMGYHKQAILEIQKIEATVGDIKSKRRHFPNEAQKSWKNEAEISAKCDKEMGTIEKLTNAKTQFENIGNQLDTTECLRWLGEVHCIQNEYPQAIEKLTDARTRFEDIGDQLGAAQCLQSLEDIHYMRGEYPQAMEKLTDARTQFEKIGDQLGAAQCLQSLGNIHYMQGDYPQAMEKLIDARSQFEKIGDQLGAAQCLQKLGDIHCNRGEYPQAMEKLTNAKIQFEKIGYQLGAAQCLRSLGDIHCMQGEYPQAMEKLTNAEIQFEKIGDQLGAAQCLQSLGNIHYMQGEYPQAMEKLTDARSQFEKIGHQLGAAQCLQSLGDIHYMQGEYPQAMEKLTDARTQLEKIGDQLGTAQCLTCLGDIHYNQGEYPQAMEKFTDARTQSEKIGNQPWVAYCLKKLGATYHMQGKYPEAIEKLTDAKNLSEKIGDQNRAADCLKNLDDIQLKLSMSPIL